ncbi:bifunctional Armadillo-like helical/Armadillo-type fold/Clathrin-coatomer adaptor [Babesia duncani]|uniref:Bifunctional Armadillo-like helical/Armadillo-type fold/Clathrin-coatomer adaptor n=1 Tax=Babesia duncani TaxID=323732 RepID=A0AAD9PN69_9APIC|nr:bifunctional Armadillo-like helical/Armadillo-type fold/Clathrin-coatomer adaptor [Babesia duncani]
MIRGLVKFIRKLRDIENDREHEYSVKSELAKIRFKLSLGNQSGYEKKKNILKLCYIRMKGYDTGDLGCLESAQLLISEDFLERFAAYLACEILLDNVDHVLRLCINTALDHLADDRCEYLSLVLGFVANVHHKEVHEQLLGPILGMIESPVESSYIRKKLYMCVLQSYRVNPEMFDLDLWRSRIRTMLDLERDVSCILAITNLLYAFVSKEPKNWDDSTSILVHRLATVLEFNVPNQYIHHGIPAPHIIIRILSLLAIHNPSQGYHRFV